MPLRWLVAALVTVATLSYCVAGAPPHKCIHDDIHHRFRATNDTFRMFTGAKVRPVHFFVARQNLLRPGLLFMSLAPDTGDVHGARVLPKAPAIRRILSLNNDTVC